jgi:uncharacterized protein with HEPN domain
LECVQLLLTAISNIQRCTDDLSRADFGADEKTEFRARHDSVEWQEIAGLRDILIHEDFGVDLDILWDVVRNKLGRLGAERPRARTAAPPPGRCQRRRPSDHGDGVAHQVEAPDLHAEAAQPAVVPDPVRQERTGRRARG